MKTRSLHHLLTLCLFALLAARAGALTIVQTATMPLDTFLDPASGDVFWDFDAFAPDDGGTLTGASLKATSSLQISGLPSTILTLNSNVRLGTGVGFYQKSMFSVGVGSISEDPEFTEPAFTPSQLTHFLDPSQSQLWFHAGVFGSDIFGNVNNHISGNATFVLTYDYEPVSANVPEAGSTGLFLGGALGALGIATRRRAFLAH